MTPTAPAAPATLATPAAAPDLAALRQTVHALVERVGSAAFLQAVAALLQTQAEADFWDTLSPATKDLILRSQQSLAAGRGVPFEEAMAKLMQQ